MMPRRQFNKPGPKSKTTTSFLGESSATETSDAESFKSPDVDGENTDYGLDYTSASTRNSRKTLPATRSSPRKNTSPKESGTSFGRRTTFIPNSRPPIESSSSAPKKKSRKQVSPRKRYFKIFREIKELQKRTDNICPKAPFGRLIREILIQEASTAHKITYAALEALQISSEIYLTNLFADAYVCTLHRGRVTLGVHDVRLVRFLRGTNDAGNKH